MARITKKRKEAVAKVDKNKLSLLNTKKWHDIN